MDIVTIFCDIDDFCQRFLAVSFPALMPGASTKKMPSRFPLGSERGDDHPGVVSRFALPYF